ncbi:transcriptional regulator [Vibrio zhanjiangensis]|uniref:Glycine cleavage system transcriptional repressor n=1 Tax=Vibrio zhanjiangensis TaxID=1046128 RepID=A0ABQ6EW58_9VIBR|nr:ACT domain-containing protein [Vibrio zhanjiangensis]GLT16815.1 transcriptional regulator [Vibrio zhanjiangensis]
MNRIFIVSFAGSATPTMIKKLASITHDHGGKWLVSKVNFLEDQVAGVIKVELPQENENLVKEAFCNCENLLVRFGKAKNHSQHVASIYKLRLDSADRAGIVNEISHTLDKQDIQILDMDCQRVFVAGGGGVSSSLFTATMTVRLPDDFIIEDVVKDLEALSIGIRVIVESS